MKVDLLADLRAFVDDCTVNAVEAAEEAELHVLQESKMLSTMSERPMRYSKAASLSLVNQSAYQDKPIYYCEKAWGVMLSVDIRGSSKRALEIGPQDTFITMHVYMRTMIRLVAKAKGVVVGLRGDGLLAVFGRTSIDEDRLNPAKEVSDPALLAATSCGDAMVNAVTGAINPILAEKDVPADLRIGVGIESGQLVITKIGLLDAFDVTAYGHCVNRAAKLSSDPRNVDRVIIGRSAKYLFPIKPGGKIQVSRLDADMHVVKYPKASTLQ